MISVDFGRRSDNSAARVPRRVRLNVVAVAILAACGRARVRRVDGDGRLDPARRRRSSPAWR